VRRHRSHTILGVVAGFAAFVMSPYLFAWMSPTILGLLLAIPLSWASGQLGLGLWLKTRGLLITPEESSPPTIATRANVLTAELATIDSDGDNALRAVHSDARFRDEHERMLPPGSRPERGAFDQDRVMARAKLSEAASLDEACRWLTPKETFLALHDRAMIALLARLPDKAEAAE
jgi:membrane glycosyltransferase